MAGPRSTVLRAAPAELPRRTGDGASAAGVAAPKGRFFAYPPYPPCKGMGNNRTRRRGGKKAQYTLCLTRRTLCGMERQAILPMSHHDLTQGGFPMHTHWTRRQFLTRVGAAAAAIQTFGHIDPCCVFAADAKTSDKDLFELKQVTDGIYAAIAAPAYKVNSNAAVILTNDGVVVVDSHSKPSAAHMLYKEIQGVTKQPIRKIINTHFHWDHWQGNQAYAAHSPNLEIITSERTKENLTRPDAGNGGISFIEKQLGNVPKEIEKLKGDILQASSPEQKARIEANLRQAEDYLEELKQLKPTLPTRTVASSVTLNEPGREIQVLLLGRGHTDGDVYIYLPKEKVVVTGDALIDWMPFLNDGYPEEWVQTLTALEKYDFTHIIPGHGEVLPKAHLTFFRGFLTDLIAAVKKAAADGASLEEMQKGIADQLAPKYEHGMSKYPLGQYRVRIGPSVEMVYQKVVKKS
jgi:cyclase